MYSTTSDLIPLDTSTPSFSSLEVARKKYPTRGGQNLALRYNRLEKSLRGKEGYDRSISDLREEAGSIAPTTQVSGSKHQKETFMDFVIPEKPKPPADDECCMSGCAICVYDLYEEALGDYTQNLASLRNSLQVLHVPEHEWPVSIRPAGHDRVERKKSTVLSAFEELERRLQEKQSHTSPPEDMPQSDVQADTAISVEVQKSSTDVNTAMSSMYDAMPAADVGPNPLYASDTRPPDAGEVQSPPTVLRNSRRRRRKTAIPDAASVFEGLRWVLFSNH